MRLIILYNQLDLNILRRVVCLWLQTCSTIKLKKLSKSKSIYIILMILYPQSNQKGRVDVMLPTDFKDYTKEFSYIKKGGINYPLLAII